MVPVFVAFGPVPRSRSKVAAAPKQQNNDDRQRQSKHPSQQCIFDFASPIDSGFALHILQPCMKRFCFFLDRHIVCVERIPSLSKSKHHAIAGKRKDLVLTDPPAKRNAGNIRLRRKYGRTEISSAVSRPAEFGRIRNLKAFASPLNVGWGWICQRRQDWWAR